MQTQLSATQYHNLVTSLLTSVETNARNGHLQAFESNFDYLERMLWEYRNLLRTAATQGSN
jgi:hypothetical protein